MLNISPNLEVKGRRVGGANYQIPIVVIGDRKLILAHRWLLDAARSEPATTKRRTLYQQAQEVIIHDAPCVALYNATGVRFYTLPLTPEKVLRRLREPAAG